MQIIIDNIVYIKSGFKMKKNYSFLPLFILFFIAVNGLTFSQVKNQKEIKFSGDLHTDSKIISQDFNYNEIAPVKFSTDNEKSPWLASLFSAILPGSGEFYAGSYIKAGIFVAIEAAFISTAIIYNHKGDNKTNDYKNYADHHWSVVKYAQWLIDYHNADSSIISNDESLPPWDRVNWSLLNQYEVGSHNLVMHGEQQYYELIGKYYQYSPGWDDYSNGANNEDISANFKYYAGQRGDANDLYNVADKAVIALYINHFLSILDAYWSTTRYNKTVAMKFRVDRVQYAYKTELVPTLKVRVSF